MITADLILKINKIVQNIILAKLNMKFAFTFGDKKKQEESLKLLENAIDELNGLFNTI